MQKQTEKNCLNCTNPKNCRYQGWSVKEDLNGNKVLSWCNYYEKYQKHTEIINKIKIQLPKPFWGKKLDNFKTDNPELESLKKLALQYLETKAWKNGSALFLYGNYGTGKTHIAASIVRETLLLEENAIFITAGQLTGTIEEIRQKFNLIKDCDLLVIDDISSEFEHKIILLELFKLINYRYESEKGFILTTNMNLSEFEKMIGGRTFDRIYERSIFFELKDSKSFRTIKRSNYIKWLETKK